MRRIVVNLFSAVCGFLSKITMYVACLCLACLLSVVIYGVVLRYGFNDAPAYVEQVALILVISVAMFGAAAGVRDSTHIGLDSFVNMFSEKSQSLFLIVVYLFSFVFAQFLLFGGWAMGVSTLASTIPTLGISEAYRYFPVVTAGVLISLFSVEHILAIVLNQKVESSWN
jgi:TRAP-type C4-dicarboxylate transport system permease small subunit